MDQVVVKSKARRSIVEAFDWWAKNRSLDQASRWLIGIESTVEALGDDPSRFALAEESGRLGIEIRQLLFGIGRRPTHRILFTVHTDEVHVLLVRHVSQRPVTANDLEG